jgi:hypothetical protein
MILLKVALNTIKQTFINRNDVKTLVNDTMEIYIVLIIQQKWCQNSGQWYHGNIHCTYYTTEMMSKLRSMIPWKYTLYLLLVSLTRVLTSFTRVLTSFLLYNKYNVYFHGIIDQSFDIISVV